MSLLYCELSYLLIKEHFGEAVAKISECLQWGPKPFSLIVSSSGLSSAIVKKALAILIQYGFVLFQKGVKIAWLAEYCLLHEKVLLLLRFPRYIIIVKKNYGVEASMVIEEVLKYGNLVGSKAILNVFKRIKQESLNLPEVTLITLRNTLHTLISNNFLIRCAQPEANKDQEEVDPIPTLSVHEGELYKSPEINMKILSNLEAGTSNEDPGDNKVYWKANFDRFNQDLRDEILINAIRSRFDDSAADLMKHLIKLMYLRTEPWAADSNPVPVIELKEYINKKSENGYLIQFYEQYLKIMDEDSSDFITKTSDSSSSQLIVNIATAFQKLSCVVIENLVDQRHGSKAARIFRLVYSKKFIEQEQIQQLAMITDKEAKLITYKLVQENFIQMQELRKPTASAGPAKLFFLFHVDMDLVVNMVTGICHKAIMNALSRRQIEKEENKRLIEKNERIEAISVVMRESGQATEEQLAEFVDEWIPPPERTLLNTIEKIMEKLQLAEIQIDSTLFILQLYSYYKALTIPRVVTKEKK